jgi:hypothetical protein
MPENDERLCNSRIWWPHIKILAEKFETSINKKGNENSVFVQLDFEKFDEALKMYERGWWTFKEHVYSEIAERERIDHHKIISLYVLSFLIKKPFSARVHPETKDKDKRQFFLANELFSLAVMQALIFAWDKNSKIFKIDEEEKKWFVILLNHFKLKLIKSNTSVISDNPSSLPDVLS